MLAIALWFTLGLVAGSAITSLGVFFGAVYQRVLLQPRLEAFQKAHEELAGMIVAALEPITEDSDGAAEHVRAPEHIFVSWDGLNKKH